MVEGPLANHHIVHGGVDRGVRLDLDLVDNAAKFDPGGTEPIELVVADGRVECRDRATNVLGQTH